MALSILLHYSVQHLRADNYQSEYESRRQRHVLMARLHWSYSIILQIRLKFVVDATIFWNQIKFLIS